MERLPLLTLNGISKSFPGVQALEAVDFDLMPGEIHALAGENGAGKSSLIKILAGIYQADAGTMYFEGAPYRPATPHAAIAAGVRVVHQEFNLLPYLSVAENVLFEQLPRKGRWFVDRRRLHDEAKRLLEIVGLGDLDPDMAVERLGVAQQQLIEIARSLSGNSRVLVLDEPTATLTPRESKRLFEIMHRLKDTGVGILFISHHLEEIFAHGDRVTVLRNGRRIATQSVAETSPAQLVKLMVGREVSHDRTQRTQATAQVALQVEDLAVKTSPRGVSFEVKAGEIVGMAGLVGSGRTEILRAIFGADPKLRGTIRREGAVVEIRSPADAIRHGICLATENRKEEGLVLPLSVANNVTLAHLHQLSRLGFVDQSADRTQAVAMAKTLDVRMGSINQAVRNLSGGNQQKVVLAKWLLKAPRVLMLDEPTRGIDVGAKAEIYALIRRLAEQGVAILVVSSDLPELLAISDRILVMSRGVLAGEATGAAMSEEHILELAYSEYLKEQRAS